MLQVKLPEIGENIETAEVSRLFVAEGDVLQAEQSVMELESEKATFPLPSPQAGRIAKMHVKAGDTVKVGQTLFEIEEGDKKAKAPGDGQAKKAPSETSKTKPPVAESKPAPAPAPQQDDKADENDSELEAETEERAAAPQAPGAPQRPAASSAHIAAGPATRRLARELGVSLEEVAAGTPGRRITRDDVKAFVAKRLSQPTLASATPPLPDFSRHGPVQRKKLSAIGRATAERMSVSWRIVPHVTQHETADITELESWRKRFTEEARQPQVKITVTAVALKASAIALKTYPQFASSLDTATSELILKDYCHIGVAVDTDHGLLVPVVRDVDKKSIETLAAELADVAERARKRALTPRDMEGGCFTISNLGGIGGTAFTPIVNYPEVAILGMGRARLQPVIKDGQPTQRLLLPLSLSYDHRVINGADGARFIVKIADLLSEPFRLLIES